jgi:hypothetical protein
MSRKPQISVTPRTESAFDIDEIIRKRLAGNPFGVGTTEIPMREPGKWATYLANGDLHPSRLYEMTARKGWVPFTVDDLPENVTPESIGFSVNEAGALCRGTRGQEIVYKQPAEVRQQIQAAKTAANMRGMGTASKVKQSIVEAASGSLGDEAATSLNQHLHVTGQDTRGPLGAA